MICSNGAVDATTTNATLLGRIATNSTLHKGTIDNAVNNTWTGTGSIKLTTDAICASNLGTTLNTNIIHICGNFYSFLWGPSGIIK